MSIENESQIKGVIDFLKGDDLEFYETFITQLSEEEEKRFFQNNPDFLKEYSVDVKRRGLLKEKMYRGILRKIKQKRNPITD